MELTEEEYQRGLISEAKKDRAKKDHLGRERANAVEAWERAGRPAAPARPGEGDVVARGPDGTCLYRYGAETPVRGATGDVEALAHYAGQSAGIVEDIRPAATIVDELVRDAAEALRSVRVRR